MNVCNNVAHGLLIFEIALDPSGQLIIGPDDLHLPQNWQPGERGIESCESCRNIAARQEEA
jgi:hypothetical protein